MSGQALQSGLLGGFPDPVDDAQRCFRALLDAMSQPGLVVPLAGPTTCPDGISPCAAAMLLTLADYATPVWFGTDAPVVREYIAFHSGAPRAQEPEKGMFAWLPAAAQPIDFGQFHEGDPEYPDRAATLIVEVDGFADGTPVRLTGPGIETHSELSAASLDVRFWQALKAKNAEYPLGVDVILTAVDAIAAIPRSTEIEV